MKTEVKAAGIHFRLPSVILPTVADNRRPRGLF